MRRFLTHDLGQVNAWHAARGLPPLSAEVLPVFGLLIDGVAAGWLYRTDAPAICLLDGLVTNPAAPLRARSRAVRSIVEGLTAGAKAGGARSVIAFTKRPSMHRFISRLGFRGGDVHRMWQAKE